MIRQTNFRTLIVKICRMLHRMSRSKCVHICYVGLVGCHHYYHYICINMDQQGKKTDGSHQLKMSWSPIITINDPPAWFACLSISDGNSPSIKRVAESATMCEQWHATYHYRVSSTCEIWSVIAMQNSKNVYEATPSMCTARCPKQKPQLPNNWLAANESELKKWKKLAVSLVRRCHCII